MADQGSQEVGMNSVFELMGDKSVAQVVDFGAFDPGFFEVAVDSGADVSD
ncbi:MAG: hypothetical protein G01um101416_916 [Microgenomates group bacterium Gr01-1014_16]|nr:MAG: hypothetical protein G01um101416_916 [Microgenomates group bacterium Gr01-1014_16]